MKLFMVMMLLISCGANMTGNNSNLSKEMQKREFPVNSKINPCDDFYAHSCSEVINHFEMRKDRSRHTFAFTDSADNILNYQKAYFKDISNRTPTSDKEKQVKNFYLSCFDKNLTANSEKAYIDTVKTKLKNIKTKKELFKYFETSYFAGENAPVQIEILENQKNPLKYDAILLSGYYTLPDPSFYEKKELAKDYLKIREMFFQIIGSKNPKKDAKISWELEKKIGSKVLTQKQTKEIFGKNTIKPKTWLVKNYPHLHLAELLAQVPKNIQVRDFMSPFMKTLNHTFGRESLENLKTLHLFLTLGGVIEDSNNKYEKLVTSFAHKHLGGAKERPERRELCTNKVKKYLAPELDYVLIDKIFPNFDGKQVFEITSKVKESIIKSLEKNTWLSRQGKAEAIRKIQKAPLNLIKPDREEDWGFSLPGNYSPEDYTQNEIQITKLFRRHSFIKMAKPVNQKKWSYSPLTVNAYYTPVSNKFVVLQGILQYPFFDPNLDIKTNMGSMGMIVGHELGHGIDDGGNRFDSTGKLRKWMTKNDIKNFKKITQPLIDQFNNIEHDGKQTLGENIGDLVGLTAAYEAAFPGSIEQYKKEDQKKFFYQFARLWCEVQTESNKKLRLKTDPHSLGKARVNEQVKHQKAFERAFSCKPGDKMTLADKDRLRIW